MRLFIALSLLSVSLPAAAGPLDDPRPQFGAGAEMSEADEAELLEAVQQRDPERFQQLQRLKTRDPAKYYDVLHRVARGLQREADDPESRIRHERIQANRHQIQALALQHASAGEGEQKKLRKEMEKLASEIFDLRQEERRSRIEHLRARLAEAEAEIEEQDANREAVIAEHLDRLLSR